MVLCIIKSMHVTLCLTKIPTNLPLLLKLGGSLLSGLLLPLALLQEGLWDENLVGSRDAPVLG